MSWKEQKKQVQQRISNFLDIPVDLMLDLPKIVLVGDVQIYIENHRGILVYTNEQVKVNSTIGEIEVNGTDLALKNIFPDEIMVEGKIKSIAVNS